MSVLMWMVANNIPLHTCDKLPTADMEQRAGYSFGSRKDDKAIAETIVAGLTHPSVVALLAKEWNQLPSVVRMRVTQLANERHSHPSSHNQQKNIGKLDKLLGGEVLSKSMQSTSREVRVIRGTVVSHHRPIRESVAAASRKYASYVKPAGFDSWPANKKRKWHEQMARDRREN